MHDRHFLTDCVGRGYVVSYLHIRPFITVCNEKLLRRPGLDSLILGLDIQIKLRFGCRTSLDLHHA